jgi:RNA-directed DNA polymerase
MEQGARFRISVPKYPAKDPNHRMMRVVDGAVLKLIKQWLEAPVVEEDQNDENRGGKPRRKVTRNTQGTPRPGASAQPLHALLLLHLRSSAWTPS